MVFSKIKFKHSIIIMLSFLFIIFISLSLKNYLSKETVLKNNSKEEAFSLENIDLSLASDELPPDYSFISMINSNEFILKKDKGLWLYDKNKNKLNLISNVLTNDYTFLKVVYSNDWVAWIEYKDFIPSKSKTIPDSKDFLRKNWLVAAKNIKTNETVIIDESENLTQDPPFEYGPNDIEISNNIVTYYHGYFKDIYKSLHVKTFDLSSKNLNLIKVLDYSSSNIIEDISMYNDTIVWNEFNGSNYDLCIYNINRRAFSKLTLNKNVSSFSLYKDTIYAIEYINNVPQLIALDINTKNEKILFTDAFSNSSKQNVAMDIPYANNDLLTWWNSTLNHNLYYNIKLNKVESLKDNTYILSNSNGYIIYDEYVNGKRHRKISKII